MRCAILRLTSRGVSPAEPRRAARLRGNPSDDLSQGRGPPSPAGLQDQAGGRWRPRRPPGRRCPKKEFLRDSTSWKHIRHRRGGGGEGSGAEEGRNGKVPGLSEPGGPAGNPHVGRAAAPTMEGEGEGEPSGSEKVPPGSGGLGGEQEARLLELRGDGGILSNGGAN